MSAKAPPLTPHQKRLFFFLSAATFFEGFDFMAITQILPNLREDMGLSRADAGLLIGVANIGPILALALVRKVDTWGRRRVMQISLSGYAICSLLTGLAPDPYSFTFLQLLSRMFLVGEWATSMVYAAEAFPAARRGWAIGIIQAMASLGAVLCAGVVPLLVQAPWGWRTVYFVGALPILLLLVARRNLPETDRFVAMKAAPPQQRSFFDVVQPKWRGRILLLALLWALVYTGTHNATTFWKDFAVTERGLTDAQVSQCLTFAAIFSLPMVFSVGRLMDRFGRKGAAAIIYPAAALGVFLAFNLTSLVGLAVALVFVIFGAASVLPIVEAYTSELFPTELRGNAFAWANNLLGRLGSVLTPPLVGVAAERVGWGLAVSVTGLANLVALGVILVALPETAARELEETSA